MVVIFFAFAVVPVALAGGGGGGAFFAAAGSSRFVSSATGSWTSLFCAVHELLATTTGADLPPFSAGAAAGLQLVAGLIFFFTSSCWAWAAAPLAAPGFVNEPAILTSCCVPGGGGGPRGGPDPDAPLALLAVAAPAPPAEDTAFFIAFATTGGAAVDAEFWTPAPTSKESEESEVIDTLLLEELTLWRSCAACFCLWSMTGTGARAEAGPAVEVNPPPAVVDEVDAVVVIWPLFSCSISRSQLVRCGCWAPSFEPDALSARSTSTPAGAGTTGALTGEDTHGLLKSVGPADSDGALVFGRKRYLWGALPIVEEEQEAPDAPAAALFAAGGAVGGGGAGGTSSTCFVRLLRAAASWS